MQSWTECSISIPLIMLKARWNANKILIFAWSHLSPSKLQCFRLLNANVLGTNADVVRSIWHETRKNSVFLFAVGLPVNYDSLVRFDWLLELAFFAADDYNDVVTNLGSSRE